MADCVRPHPQNADGAFYVTDGCCTACGVPISSAPDLFAWDSREHCFVRRQPSTPVETDQMLRAVRGAELDCIRYRGRDPDILERFAELGVPQLCDHGGRFDIAPALRNQVTFVLTAEPERRPEHVAAEFRAYFLGLDPERNRATPVTSSDGSASFSCAWFEDQFHPVSFRSGAESESWLIQHQGNLGVSDLLQEWLTKRGATRVQWFADSDRNRSGSWRATPW